MNAKFVRWLSSATKAEIRELARLSGTSTRYLNHIKNGRRNASPDIAGRISNSAEAIRGGSAERMVRLPLLHRGDIASVCAACPFYKKACKGKNQ